ncbi:MAG: hypothetical protein BTN85_1314 [Candidatus Methanohalarchaeum thermophilum]|uniref:Uncharacterized protein n=1 Tax=Methanohalarchaeum thermophilum TaxID=1903181 RepID=A0A1Q6DWS1_METT1|nr:MAG: hypothetical protein BTN85_1314 [Candidatus Methanohalarchaeum thermophilum]
MLFSFKISFRIVKSFESLITALGLQIISLLILISYLYSINVNSYLDKLIIKLEGIRDNFEKYKEKKFGEEDGFDKKDFLSSLLDYGVLIMNNPLFGLVPFYLLVPKEVFGKILD